MITDTEQYTFYDSGAMLTDIPIPAVSKWVAYIITI
jgi:hypothetical protein